MWSGIVTSRYTINDVPVKVVVTCLPESDVIAVQIESALLVNAVMGVSVAFPRGHDIKTKNNPKIDWTQPETHQTAVLAQSDRAISWEHVRDDARYYAALSSEAPVAIEMRGAIAHRQRPSR